MNEFDKYIKEKIGKDSLSVLDSIKSRSSKAFPNCRQRKAKLLKSEHFREQ